MTRRDIIIDLQEILGDGLLPLCHRQRLRRCITALTPNDEEKENNNE